MNTARVNREIDEMRHLMAMALKLGFMDDARYWLQEIKIAEAEEREV